MADGYTQKYDNDDISEMTIDGIAKAGDTGLDFLDILVLLAIVSALAGGIVLLIKRFGKITK